MTEVTERAGEPVDVVEHHNHFGQLQKSTGTFFRTLEDWRIRSDFSADPPPYALVVMRSLIAEYVTAYKVGMSAAQDVYDFATSGLSLANIITSDIGPAERESYIAQMQSFATQGKTKSEQALESMRELRHKLNSHLDRMKTGSKDSVRQDEIADFGHSLSILRQFEECMDWYIKWWTKTGMTSSHQDTGITQYSRNGGDLRLRGIQLQWKNLQDVYLHYRIEMQKFQDQYSGVFKLVHDLKPNDDIDIPTYPPLGPMLEGDGTVQRQGTSERNAGRHSNSPLPLSTAYGPSQRILDETESNQRQASTRLLQNSETSDQRIVKETVLSDIPQPSVEGLDIQQEITGFDHALESTSGRLTVSAKSDNGIAAMADNRSTGRRNEESSDGRERSTKKTGIGLSNPPEVLPVDDSSASLKTAWTNEESSNHSNSVAQRQQGSTSPKHIDKDDFTPLSVKTMLGKTDKPPSFHSSSSKNGKSSGYHHTSPQLLKTDSKASHRTQPDPTTSRLKRSASTNQRTSIEMETGDEFASLSAFPEASQIVDDSKLLPNDLGDSTPFEESNNIPSQPEGTGEIRNTDSQNAGSANIVSGGDASNSAVNDAVEMVEMASQRYTQIYTGIDLGNPGEKSKQDKARRNHGGPPAGGSAPSGSTTSGLPLSSSSPSGSPPSSSPPSSSPPSTTPKTGLPAKSEDPGCCGCMKSLCGDCVIM